ncbi:hypothetical protein [Mesorhizobium australicum]|uniref:Uncharacterized protein n=1 Tax=Mesorhizobium australicum TaxID=536018 RepID=A0A1X7NXL0_9HYPH|nr:hypothetical protein [Mesorhizobium australicum]SMH42239.1 hypothetical protein SAMN02982922_2721 [Mesorhizobium australicum]
MAGIWFQDGSVRVRSYSSATKGRQRLIRIELEVDDPYDLADVLRQLDAMQEPKAKKPAKPLQIEDQRGRS